MSVLCSSSSAKRTCFLLAVTILVLFGLLLVEAMHILLLPRVLSVKTVPPALETQHGFLHARIDNAVTVRVHVTVHQSEFAYAPRRFHSFSSGVIETLGINGVPVQMVEGVNSFFAAWNIGTTTLDATVRRTESKPIFSFGFRPTFWNPVTGMALLFGFCILYFWLRFLRASGYVADVWTWRVLLGGTALRYLYALSTPFFINAYDFMDHVQYVRYVAEYGRMPQSIDMWQGFQMPLYYVLLTPVFLLSKSLGFELHEIGELLSVPSILLSVFTLLLLARIIGRFPTSSAVTTRLCLLVAATFPGLVYLSGQVSNDTLVTTIGFVWVAALLGAWEQPSNLRHWLWVAVLCGVGMLVKMSAAPWAIISLAALAWTGARGNVPRVALTTSLFCLTVTVAGGWLYAYRGLTDDSFHLVANTSFSSLQEVLPTSTETVIGFNPIRLLRLPFDAQLSSDPLANVYAEELLRTAHFGSLRFTQEAAVLLVLFLMLLPLFFFGALQELRADRPVLLLVFFGLFFAGVFMRLRYPYVPCQHFRYIAVIFLPAILFLKSGLAAVQQNKVAAVFTNVMVAVYAIACAALVLSAVVSV